MQILSPGMQHGEEADGCAQKPRISGGFKHGGRRGAEQEGLNLFRVLHRQSADLSGQREYDVEVRNRKKLGFALREPSGAGRGLALGAMPIAARVIEDDAMSAPVALLEVTAQGRSPAVPNVPQRFPLLAR